MTVRAAVANYRLRPIRSDAGYFGHLHDVVTRAHDQGATLLVLPELHVLELIALEPSLPEHKVPAYLAQYAQAVEDWLARIAATSGLTLVGGTVFRREGEDGPMKNVGVLATPQGTVRRFEKNLLTRYEREMWDLADGVGLVREGEVGALVCYDSEFPEAGRRLAEDGARVLAVPSWTETVRGHQRVRWSCLARAVENQAFVLHASLVGDLGREPVPASCGSSAIIAPSVEPFPERAILAETPEGEDAVAVADLDFEALDQAREYGEVANWLDRARSGWTLLSPGAADVSESPE